MRPAENECVFGRLQTLWKFHEVSQSQHVEADSHVSGNRIRQSESGPFVIDDYIIMTVFITREPVEDNTVSEYIRTVATTYVCKILQLYEYDANLYAYDANCESHPINTSSCSIKYS